MWENDEHPDPQKVIEEFEEMTTNAEEVQKELLKDILEKNESTLYLQKYGLNGSREIEDFKERVPLITHADIDPYIQRMARGDNSPLLTSQPIDRFTMSSGTTRGRPMLVPLNKPLMDRFIKMFHIPFAYRNREYPVAAEGKTLQFLYTNTKSYNSEGGMAVAAFTTHAYGAPTYKAVMRSTRSMYCSPDEVIFSPDTQQATYCHLLCGILFWEEIQYVYAPFCMSLTQAFGMFERVWEDIVVDIRDGVLSSKIAVPSVREAVSKLLTRPNPGLADVVRSKCMSSSLRNWKGIIPTLFPNAKYVYGIMTGAMEPYVNKLRNYAGELPIISQDYLSSEGWIGLNATPSAPLEETTYVPIPNFNYYEFLPVSEVGENPKTVGLTEAKVGEEYEIVLTNYQGFYRYKLGDIVKVMGFYNKTPQLKYVCRRNVILSIHVDKVTERDLQLSIDAAAKKLLEEKLEVIDFTSRTDMSSEPGHYVIFWEISGHATDQTLQECCNILDFSLPTAAYGGQRERKSIGPLELNILQKGTFGKIQEHLISQGASPSQIKIPKAVPNANKRLLQIISENVINRLFSTAYA